MILVQPIHLGALDHQWHCQVMVEGPRTTVRADSLPLHVVGQVIVPVSLGEVQARRTFRVIRSLTTVESDFLARHGAVMDCRAAMLDPGKYPNLQLLISIGWRQSI